MDRERRDPDEVVDLTGPGRYTFLDEGTDDRRYGLSWWLPAGVVAFIVVFVAVLVLP